MLLRKDLLATFFLIIVAPFCVFIHFAPLGDFWEFFIVCSAVVICAVVILGRAGFADKVVIVSPTLLSLSGFLVVLCLLTLLQSSHLQDQMTLVIYSAVVLLTGLLALRLADRNSVQYYDYLAFVLFIGGLIESFSAIAIQYRLAGIDYWMVPMSDRLIGFVAQSNQLAIYVMVSFLALCYLTYRGIFHVVLLVVFSLLFGFVLLGSGSRAVLVYLFAILSITVFCGYKSKNKRYFTLTYGMVALLVGAAFYYYLPIILQHLLANTSDVVESTAAALSRSAASDSFRLSEIAKAFAMLKSAPLLGVGFGNYAVQGFWLGVDDPKYTLLGDLTLHSHNIFAQIMAEFGLVGLLSLLAIVGYIFICFWRRPKTLQWWLVSCVFAVYFINSLLEYVMWRMHFVPLLFLFLVPLLADSFKLTYPRLVNGMVTLMVVTVFITIANSSLTNYAKSFFYHDELMALDQEDFATFKSATNDLIWGREIQMQALNNLSPIVLDLAYQQKITDEMLAWRPYPAVLANKIQWLLLTNQTGYLDKYARALRVAYPSVVPSVCEYFKSFDTLSNLQALRVVQKELNCRLMKPTAIVK